MPRFDDRQFEQTFRLKREMVGPMIANLAKLSTTLSCCRHMTIIESSAYVSWSSFLQLKTSFATHVFSFFQRLL